MRSKSLILVVAFVSIVVIGCGQDAEPPHVTVPATTSTSTTTTAPPPTTEVTTTTEAPTTTTAPVQAAAAAKPVIVAATVPPTTEPAPTPAPEPPTEPTVAPANDGSAEGAIAAWFPDLYDKAVRVATCESGMTPGAVSPGGGNYGLFQINRVHAQGFYDVTGVPFDQGWSDPYLNAEYARALYDSAGWGPWSCGHA